MRITAPISAGELVDKLTILRVKLARLSLETQKANVRQELALLQAIAERELAQTPIPAPLVEELEAVNAALWDIEEGKRACERRWDFGRRFVHLARRVYRMNDRRAALKRVINELAQSDIVEEKSHFVPPGSLSGATVAE